MSFVESSYTVDESNGFQSVCVELAGGTVERRVTISLASSDGDAVSKSHPYTNTPPSVVIYHPYVIISRIGLA